MSKLLDSLNELGRQDRGEVDPMDVVQNASFEDDGDVPGVNEQLQQAGANAFNRFQRRVNDLDKEVLYPNTFTFHHPCISLVLT
jgi:hypothetical protein